ncbi:hypothetical protein GUJ93_ZPchr0001g33182 [Zizania palustris]|uniref:Uncharacterized protein n=1 Tax=Zizania palustris TaxID=103762 RepID=A0A8J5RV90_ZIZPA|nr:hypothetical protein GUJ93_ZPchr0001g33182 [Zizania palustris]
MSWCDSRTLPCLLLDLHNKPLLLLWKRHALACGNSGPPLGLNLGLKVEDPPLLLRNLPLASLKLCLQASELLSLGLNLLPALTLLQSIHVIHRLHHTRHVDDGGVLLMLGVVEKAEGLPLLSSRVTTERYGPQLLIVGMAEIQQCPKRSHLHYDTKIGAFPPYSRVGRSVRPLGIITVTLQ